MSLGTSLTTLITTITITCRVVAQRLGRPSHGSVVFLHSAFKLVALFLYLITLHSFITTFILVVLLLSADFWVVKNISGRLLAGLRWWSIVDDDGKVGTSRTTLDMR